MMSPEIRRLIERINDYLQAGRLWNPELMEHDKVRLLLFDIRDGLDALLAPPGVSPLPSTEDRQLCEACGGNGVVKLFSGTAQIGTSVCPACHGDCWATRPAAPPPVDPQPEGDN